MAERDILPIDEFGGLILNSSGDEVGLNGALDLLNVDLNVRGAVRTRPGTDGFVGTGIASDPDSMAWHQTTGGEKRVLIGHANGDIAAFRSSGSAGTLTTPTSGPHYFTRFGTPNEEATYFTNGLDGIRKYVPNAFSAPASLVDEKVNFLAVSPRSNRLIGARHAHVGGIGAAGRNQSSVRFSAQDAPEDFTANHYVDLDTGDGESIMGLIAWREYVFVFKRSKFWVIYGEQTSTAGALQPDIRKIDAGIGLAAEKALCATPHGVYFMHETGIYRTTGGPPQLVSSALDPLFLGTVPKFFGSPIVGSGNIAKSQLMWHADRLYVAYTADGKSANSHMLVYDPRYNYWLLWNVKARALLSAPIWNDNRPALVIAYTNDLGNGETAKFTDTVDTDFNPGITDDAPNIVSRYRTGLYRLSDGAHERRAARTRLWGTGTIIWKTARDWDDLSSGQTVALGVSPVVTSKEVGSRTKPGFLWSHQIEANSGRWAVYNVTHELDPPKPLGSRTP